MELIYLALPFATTAVMFGLKKLASFNAFNNGAEARPWLRTLLIVISIFGVGATGLLNGQEVNPDSIKYLLELLVGTVANGFLSHAFYKDLGSR